MATNTVATKQTHTAANNASGNTSGPYTISFDYLLESDVEVRVNNTLKTQTTHYTFPSKTSIQFTSGNFPTLGATIEIKRNTDITVPKVDFQDGSVLTESDLDNNSKHLLFGMQETKEDTESLVNTFVSPTAPTGISNGARWYDTVSGRTFIYYVDADTAQWVEANPPFAASELPSVSNTHVVANAGIEGSKLQASSGSNAGSMSAANFTKLAGIETGATADQTNAEIRAAIEAASDSNVFTDADHSKLNAIEAGATADQTNAEIKTAYEANANTNEFSDAEQAKLAGIEASATADQTAAEIRTLVESASDSNVFTDADHSKLNAIEASATADQTAAEIRTLVESASDSNVFTDADHSKLNAIEAGATADQTAAEIKTLLASSGITNTHVDNSAAIATTKLSFTQAGTGAVARTLDSKLQDVISVKDFGAVGNGSTDDATAIQAAVDYSSSSGGKTIHFPAGTYKVNTSINLKNYTTLVGDSAEFTRVLAGGNFPIFQHLGVPLKEQLFNGTGSQTVFQTQISYTPTSTLQVYVNNVLQTLTTHYSVTQVSGQNKITFNTAPVSGTNNVKIVRLADTVGDVSIRHMQMRGNGALSSGAYTVGDKSFGIFCDFGGDWLIEDCDFRLCKIGYFQGTSRNNTLSKLDFTLCYDCLYFGPIDISGGGTPDNTCFIDTIDAASTVNCGMRIEGCTGMKIINSSFVQGVEGIYTGDYVQANSPRAILDGNTNNVPAAADARRIRFFHLNNVYTDTILLTPNNVTSVNGASHTGSGIGYRFMPVANTIPLQDVRLVNCWAGNTDSVTAAMHFKSIVSLHIVGCSIIHNNGRGILINGVDNTGHADDTKNIVINGLVIEDFDRNNAGLSGLEVITADGVAINNISGDADREGATDTAISYLVKLNNCDRNVISNLTTDERLLLIANCDQTVVSNCISRISGQTAIAESGTSDKSIITNCITTQAISLLGSNSVKADNIES